MAYDPQQIKDYATQQGWVKADGSLADGGDQKIYDAAKQYGVSGSQLDTAFGWGAGTADNYATSKNWGALGGAAPAAAPAPAPTTSLFAKAQSNQLMPAGQAADNAGTWTYASSVDTNNKALQQNALSQDPTRFTAGVSGYQSPNELAGIPSGGNLPQTRGRPSRQTRSSQRWQRRSRPTAACWSESPGPTRSTRARRR